MLQTFDFGPSGRQIDAKGLFFRYESSSAPTLDASALRVWADGSDLGIVLPGDNITLPRIAIRWEVIPVTQFAGCVRIGTGQMSTSRLATVERSAPATALERALAGNSFLARVDAAASSQCPYIGLYAPTGAPVLLSMICGTQNSGWNAFVWLVTQDTWTRASAPVVVNRKNGGRAPAAALLAGSMSAPTTPPPGAVLVGWGNTTGGYLFRWPPPTGEPFIVPPGAGVILTSSTGGTSAYIAGSIDFDEP